MFNNSWVTLPSPGAGPRVRVIVNNSLKVPGTKPGGEPSHELDHAASPVTAYRPSGAALCAPGNGHLHLYYFYLNLSFQVLQKAALAHVAQQELILLCIHSACGHWVAPVPMLLSAYLYICNTGGSGRPHPRSRRERGYTTS